MRSQYYSVPPFLSYLCLFSKYQDEESYLHGSCLFPKKKKKIQHQSFLTYIILKHSFEFVYSIQMQGSTWYRFLFVLTHISVDELRLTNDVEANVTWHRGGAEKLVRIRPLELMNSSDGCHSCFSLGEGNVARPQALTEGNCNSSLHLKEITDLPLCFRRFRWLVSTCKDGWMAYYRQPVFLAGMGLAFLYTTVLGFDCITTGYAYTQGISGSLLSLLMGVSAITGLMGTIMFTRLRKAYGLVNTGIISSCLHLGCLLLCVCSVFAPGSPMDLSLLMPDISSNSSTALGMTGQRQKHTYPMMGGNNQPLLPDRSSIHWTNNTVLFDNVPSGTAPESYISIILLFLGVITARIGE